MGIKLPLDPYEDRNILPLLRTGSQFLDCPTRSLVTIPNKLNWTHDMKPEVILNLRFCSTSFETVHIWEQKQQRHINLSRSLVIVIKCFVL